MSSVRLTWLLIVLNLLAVLWAVSVYKSDDQVEIISTAPTEKPVELPAFPAFIPQSGEAYLEIVDRPLFNELRQPPENEEVPIEKVTKNRDNRTLLKLVGVALQPEGSQALILKPDRTVEKISTGQKIDGWELLSIDEESVLLQQSGQELRLLLERKSQNLPANKRRLPAVRKK